MYIFANVAACSDSGNSFCGMLSIALLMYSVMSDMLSNCGISLPFTVMVGLPILRMIVVSFSVCVSSAVHAVSDKLTNKV